MEWLPCLIFGLLMGSMGTQGVVRPPATPAERYLMMLSNIVEAARKQIPEMTASAEEAAKLILNGGTLWVGGRQKDFIAEAYARAGGLMGLKVLNEQAVKQNDVILYAVPETLQENDIKKIQNWSDHGIYVLAFACRDSDLRSNIILGSSNRFTGLAMGKNVQHKIIPVDTIANVIYLWAWTGEFVSACTRQGKMPILYLSYGMRGGYERAKKYEGKVFHDDLTINPIKAGLLAGKYLDVIESGLKSVRWLELEKICKAAQWWREFNAKPAEGVTMGHLFPTNFEDVRAPKPIKLTAGDQHATIKEGSNDDKNERFILFVGYQYPPQKLVEQAMRTRIRLVYMSVQPATPAEVKDRIIYINPHWPLPDGCVDVPGYDVTILPASGVMDAAIYWAMTAQREIFIKDNQ